MRVHLSRNRGRIFLIEYQIKVGIFRYPFVQAAVSARCPTVLTIQGKTFPRDKLVRPFYQRDWFSLPPPRGVDGVILWLIFVSCGVVVVTVNSAARPRLIYVGMCACGAGVPWILGGGNPGNNSLRLLATASWFKFTACAVKSILYFDRCLVQPLQHIGFFVEYCV